MAGIRNNGVDTSAWYLPAFAGTEALSLGVQEFDPELVFGYATAGGAWRTLFGSELTPSPDIDGVFFNEDYLTLSGYPPGSGNDVAIGDLPPNFVASRFIRGAVIATAQNVPGVSPALYSINAAITDTTNLAQTNEFTFNPQQPPVTSGSLESVIAALPMDNEPTHGQLCGSRSRVGMGAVTGELYYYRVRPDFTDPYPDVLSLPDGPYVVALNEDGLTATYYPCIPGSSANLLETFKNFNANLGALGGVNVLGFNGVIFGGGSSSISPYGWGLHDLPLVGDEEYLVTVDGPGVIPFVVRSPVCPYIVPALPGMWATSTSGAPSGKILVQPIQGFGPTNRNAVGGAPDIGLEASYLGTPFFLIEGPSDVLFEDISTARTLLPP